MKISIFFVFGIFLGSLGASAGASWTDCVDEGTCLPKPRAVKVWSQRGAADSKVVKESVVWTLFSRTTLNGVSYEVWHDRDTGSYWLKKPL